MKNKIAKNSTTWVFIAVCWMAYSFSYIGRLNFSASMADMTSSGVLLASQAGTVTTGFFICYGCGQFLSGILGDKISPRYLVFTGLLCSALINLGISLSPPFWLMVALWSMNGLAQALLWAPICKIVSDRVSDDKRQKACTVLATTMAAGTLFAYILSAVLISLYGWTASFICGMAATLFAALVWITVTTKIEHDADKNGIVHEAVLSAEEEEGEEVPHDEVPTNLFKLFAVSGLAILALAGGVQGVLKDCMSTWVPTFITDMFDMGAVISILTGTMLPIAGLFGPYIANKLIVKTRDELYSLFVLFLISAGSLSLLTLFGRFSLVISIISLAVTYACSLGQNMIIIGNIPMYFYKVGKVSTVTGTLNSVSYISTAAVSWLTGVLVEKTGWGMVMLLWLLLAVFAAGATLLAKRRWNKFRRNLF
ncbi:MAG: MFS transporter [Oscillospiraceae bacterium]